MSSTRLGYRDLLLERISVMVLGRTQRWFYAAHALLCSAGVKGMVLKVILVQ